MAAELSEDPPTVVSVLDALPVAQLAYLFDGDQLNLMVDVVAFGREAIGGGRSREQIDAEHNTCITEANSAWRRGDERAQEIWLGAAGMLGGVPVANRLTALPDDHHRDDTEIDPDIWDPAFTCSVAAGGGVPGERGGDRELRRRYWWWWLRTAVPTAAGLLGTPLDAVDARHAYRTRELLALRDWSEEQQRDVVRALEHRAPDDPKAWKDRHVERQARDERQELGL
jgi:hypothetical protein